jgi:release factor glutamine methyltransferase
MASAPVRDASIGIRRRLRSAVEILRAAGVENPQLDAELLLAAAAVAPRERVLAALIDFDDALGVRFDALIRLRAARMPLAYIVGRREFYAIDLEVAPEVLIPRPETEALVSAALAELEERPYARVLDMGTGSGAIAIAIAANAPDSRIVGTDFSDDALEIAAKNAMRLGFGARIEFIPADCWDAAANGEARDLGRFDLVVSNPPYIRNADIDRLAAEIRRYEPRIALAGGDDGLDFYQRIAAGLERHLAPAGALIVEIGQGQATAVSAILGAAGLGEIATINDLAGVTRLVSARRRGAQ